MKEIGSFISPDADWNTHTLWNCVPQTHELNAGIWLDLEKKTIAWANTYQDIWVICGPYYSNRQTAIKIGDEQSGTISVPPYTWKIVVRTNSWHVVAAMYDQNISIKGPFDHHPYLLSVLDIENKTGIKVGIPDSLKNQTNDFEHF
jgi:endonuclease G